MQLQKRSYMAVKYKSQIYININYLQKKKLGLLSSTKTKTKKA